MVTVAVISILFSIAIPLYNGYVREGHLTTIRTNMNHMRTAIEDHRLDNGTYVPAGFSAGAELDNADIVSEFGLEPGDLGPYTYTVAVGTNSYDVWGVFNTNIWARCDDRFGNCCDPDSGSAATSACP
jgi:type IV pilus assembly protein PilE